MSDGPDDFRNEGSPYFGIWGSPITCCDRCGIEVEEATVSGLCAECEADWVPIQETNLLASDARQLREESRVESSCDPVASAFPHCDSETKSEPIGIVAVLADLSRRFSL